MQKYKTNLTEFSEVLEVISPYHYYQNRYWGLRQKWRHLLFDWTRMEPCDVTVKLDKDYYIAGTTDTLTFTFNIGENPLEKGARIALYFPMFLGGAEHLRELAVFQGPDGQAGYGARINAEASVENVEVCLNIHSVGSIFTCVELGVEKGCLTKGDKVKIIVGDTLENKPLVISEKAQTLTFRTAVDFKGNDVFRPIKPDIILNGRGNTAEKLICCAPATPEPGKSFKLKVTAADNFNGNPAYDYSADIKVKTKGADIESSDSYSVKNSEHGVFEIDGFVKKEKSGVSRIILTDEDNAIMGISNPICPKAAPDGMSIYYGEIHSHTELSDGVGSPDDAMRWARDVEKLDFSAIADHFERGQCYNYTREHKWKINQYTVDKYHDSGSFVALHGYEIGTLEAHRNVYFPDNTGRMIVNDDNGEKVTMDNVYDKLEGTDYILIPHAPKYHGINWYAQHKPERQRLVEICSAWGISEEGGPKSVRAGLDLGLKLGFTGGTDNHSAEPAHAFYDGFGGLTGLFAGELTRKGIFEALMARRTFATNGVRMIVNFNVNSAFMGEEISLAQNNEIRITGRAITASAIKAVDIIRNGEVIHSISPNEKCDDITVDWTDPDSPEKHIIEREITREKTIYYYLRVRTTDGKFGWASPVWVNK